MTELTDWKIFQATRKPHNRIKQLPSPPQWRNFNNREDCANEEEIESRWQKLQELAARKFRDRQRGQTFWLKTENSNDVNNKYDRIIDAVNAALYLRRPLLVTGKPGSGKTSLAYAIAYELQLGPVLLWPINTRSSLQEGLYRYDAIARLQDVQLGDSKDRKESSHLNSKEYIELTQRIQDRRARYQKDPNNNQNIGEYIQLGPIGTAFLPSLFPRVLLIDEIDKSDINLPNDLLNLFEEGEFEIPELARLSKYLGDRPVTVRTKDDNIDAPVKDGRINCSTFPFIIMTSNAERDFPPAFLRRCLRVDMPQPEQEELTAIVKAQLNLDNKQTEELIKYFADSVNNGNNLAIDQLLNIIYLVTNEKVSNSTAILDNMKSLLLKSLNNK